MISAEEWAKLHALINRSLESYISVCYEMAAHGSTEQKNYWQQEALWGESVKGHTAEKFQEIILILSHEVPLPQAYFTSRKPSVVLCVIVGTKEPLFTSDLAALRQVRAQTGLDFQRIAPCSKGQFDDYFRRERSLKHPVTLLHISAHAGQAGVMLADGLVDGTWLSERLDGVEVLLLAGCNSDVVGDWLGVVPHVITLREEISGQDAATLTLHFWTGIGHGLNPDTALTMALDRCPPVVREFVVRHW